MTAAVAAVSALTQLAAGQARISWGSVPAGADRSEASARSACQSILGLGGRTPGRSLGTRTRSAPVRTAQRTGVGIMIVSPSIPTGISGSSASTTTSPAARTIVPPPPSNPTAPIALLLLATGSFARQLLLAMTLSVALGAFGDHQWPLVLIVIITLVNLSGANLAGEIAGLVSGQPSFTAVPEALTISMLLPTDS